MRKVIFVLVCGLFVFGKCKKSTGVQVDFVPLTVGSNWTYQNNPGGTSKLTVTSKDTTVASGRSYKVLSNSTGPNAYWGKSGNEYYRFSDLQGAIPQGFEELYLKSDQSVNATWMIPVQVNVPGLGMQTVNLGYKIVEQGLNKTVQGNNYSDVTKVSLTATLSIATVGTGEFFYAKGVGLISGTMTFTGTGAPTTQTTELVSYEIK